MGNPKCRINDFLKKRQKENSTRALLSYAGSRRLQVRKRGEYLDRPGHAHYRHVLIVCLPTPSRCEYLKKFTAEEEAGKSGFCAPVRAA